MARIRNISLSMLERMKPLTSNGRNLASHLSLVCDDAGRVLLDPEAIAAILFPGDAAAVDGLDAWLDELERHGWIERYTVDDVDYLRMIDWNSDQTIGHPTPSRLPPSPGEPLMNSCAHEALKKIQGRGRNRSTDQALAGQRQRSGSSHVFSDGKSSVVVTTESVVCELHEIAKAARDDLKHKDALQAVLRKAEFAGVKAREHQKPEIEVDPVDGVQAATASDGLGGETAQPRRPPPNELHGLPDTSGRA